MLMSVNDVSMLKIEGNHAESWDTLDVDLRIESIVYLRLSCYGEDLTKQPPNALQYLYL